MNLNTTNGSPIRVLGIQARRQEWVSSYILMGPRVKTGETVSRKLE